MPIYRDDRLSEEYDYEKNVRPHLNSEVYAVPHYDECGNIICWYLQDMPKSEKPTEQELPF